MRLPPLLMLAALLVPCARRSAQARPAQAIVPAAGAPAAPRARTDTLRIGVLASPAAARGETEASMLRGVELGADEANRAASLLGHRVELVHAAAGGIDESLARFADARVTAIVGGADEKSCESLADALRERAVLWLNAACASDALRGRACSRWAFHVAPSDAMRRDARRLGDAPADAPIESWHPSLERFGAAQLGERFLARFGRPMDSPAWQGWLAVKVLGEASLRARSTDPVALRDWLERADARVDGHKGQPLSFRAWDHQLRQPLYRVAPVAAAPESAPTPVEVPHAPPGERIESRVLLDRLGAGAGETACRWHP